MAFLLPRSPFKGRWLWMMVDFSSYADTVVIFLMYLSLSLNLYFFLILNSLIILLYSLICSSVKILSWTRLNSYFLHLPFDENLIVYLPFGLFSGGFNWSDESPLLSLIICSSKNNIFSSFSNYIYICLVYTDSYLSCVQTKLASSRFLVN